MTKEYYFGKMFFYLHAIKKMYTKEQIDIYDYDIDYIMENPKKEYERIKKEVRALDFYNNCPELLEDAKAIYDMLIFEELELKDNNWYNNKRLTLVDDFMDGYYGTGEIDNISDYDPCL